MHDTTPTWAAGLRPGVALLALVWACGGAGPAVAWLGIEGETIDNGIFDPSIEVDPKTGTAWLVYSNVYGRAEPWGPHVETHLASSRDGGATWQFEAAINTSTPGEITRDEGPESGHWNHEVPSLVYDATDPGSEWKLMLHKVFRLDVGDPFGEETTVWTHSWLELHTAAAPTGPWSLVSRFGAGPLPPAAYPIDQAWNDLDDALSSTRVYSEPGLIAWNGRLYLSISALQPDGFAAAALVALLASDDHGASWQWVGPLLTPEQAESLGYQDFGGSAIVAQRGRLFLLVSPGTRVQPRHGTAIFEIVDLDEARLHEVDGLPWMLDQIPLEPMPGSSRFGGQAEFHEEAAAGGILMNQLETAAIPELFRVRETGVTPIPEPSARAGAWVTALVVFGMAAFARRRPARFR